MDPRAATIWLSPPLSALLTFRYERHDLEFANRWWNESSNELLLSRSRANPRCSRPTPDLSALFVNFTGSLRI